MKRLKDHRVLLLFLILIAASLRVHLSGCAENSEQAGDVEARTETEKEQATEFGTTDDIAAATSIWSQIQGYEDWSSYPGMEGWQIGQSPHGTFLKIYHSEEGKPKGDDGVASRPEDGYVIVKENYTAKDPEALDSITIMKKVEGFDPENANWFWVKYAPGGDVLKNERGRPLAGRVAKGTNKGCIACHANALGDDYVFANDSK